MTRTYNTIIIGAGIAGLNAGRCLGKSTLILALVAGGSSLQDKGSATSTRIKVLLYLAFWPATASYSFFTRSPSILHPTPNVKIHSVVYSQLQQ